MAAAFRASAERQRFNIVDEREFTLATDPANRERNNSLLITGFPPRERVRLAPHLETLRHVLNDAEDIRRTGSAALDLAYVAAGRVDAYFEAGVKAWDIAAGVLLVREAGGRCCDFRGNTEAIMHGGQIIASGLKLSDTLQKTMVDSGYAAAFDAPTLLSASQVANESIATSETASAGG